MDQVIEKLQNADNILEVTDLCKFFKAGRKQTLKAVDHVTIGIKRGETLGLVGESGCGKTTCGRTMIKLYEPTSGKVVKLFPREWTFISISAKKKKQNELQTCSTR